MALYEHVYLARQDVTAQQVDALTEQLKGVIQAGGGKIAKTEYWGVKSLAYRIKKNRKAHFTLMNIDAPPAAVLEMERLMRINEDVLRVLTVRVDELEEGQSAMLRKREDSDRDGPHRCRSAQHRSSGVPGRRARPRRLCTRRVAYCAGLRAVARTSHHNRQLFVTRTTRPGRRLA